MNNRKSAVISALAVVLAVCVALGLSGCASDKSDAQANTSTVPPDPALVARLVDVLQAAKKMTSVHLAVRTTGKVESLAGISSVDVDGRAKPLAAKGVCTYQGNADVPFRLKDDNVSVKLFDDWSSLGSMKDLASTRVLDPINGVSELLDGITNLKSQGTEVIDGVPTTKISATIPTASVKLLDPGARSPKPVTVWIADDGSNHVIQANVDFENGSVQVKLSKFNEPVNFD
jgi:hypothetical protein